ncbi:glycoside hydrolase family 19 protein [Chryseobacterium taihuense]|uniref:Predicted chitinase n=1 Tax=Chryseobacterium taihuense TaxID=1141221 RepID=A0ABY0QNQ7_9FLAO|nr:hypothetical protein [Chryseobacterium taihuense]SDL40188.1 Predicted chitinase [Chryseobacterium taihuense]
MEKISILGNQNPEIGTPQQYSVFKVFEIPTVQSPAFGNQQEVAHWEIHVLERGNWRKTDGNTKTGDTVSYTFNQKSLTRKGIKLVVTKGNDKGELILKTKPAKQPKINKIELLDVNKHKVTKPLSYADILYAKAYCTDMEGENLFFTLWEDDAKGAGHSKTNQVNKINTFPVLAKVKKGIAEARFNMAQYTMASMVANMQVAKGDKTEGKTHEYYVTAEYFGKLDASNNVNLKNTAYNESPKVEPKKVPVTNQPKTTPKPPNKKPTPPAPAPKKETYKKPITPKAKTKTPDAKGKIKEVSFVDFAGRPLESAKYGTTVKVKITAQNMKGRTVKLKVWEDDMSNQLVFEHNYILAGDLSFITLPLTQAMQDKGDDWKEGSEQELFLEVEYAGQSIDSEVIDVDEKAPPKKIETGRSEAVVKGNNQKGQSNNKCPNCEKDITLEQIKAICVSKKNRKGIETCLIEDDTMIKKALPFLNKYRKKVGINTCITKAHFLAQISHESKFYDLQERFKYSSASRMNGIFDSYFKQFGRNRMHEAERLSELSLKKENWPEVANAIYGKTHPNGKKHTDSNDGWRYSGKGFKQITWKGNYEQLEKYANKIFGTKYDWTDGDNPYKLKKNPEDAITSALAFWGKHNINSVATEVSNISVKNVTALINPALDGLKERQRYFKKAVEILKVKECKPKGEIKVSNEKGTVVLVSGTDKVLKNDPAKAGLQWMMYQTSVYRDMSLATFKKLKRSNKLPEADYVTYLSRDTHQVTNSKGTEIYKHSDKRFGQYNEIPPGEYFLVPGLVGQKYLVYVIDSESKSASDENGIDGPDGSRGGVALHHYCPRFSVGCFTFNSGKNTQPVKDFINEIPDLKLKDNRPVHFIVEPRQVKETVWGNPKYGTKKWIGI